MKDITLSRKQQIRVEVITRVAGGSLSKEEAAERMGITRRQMDNVLRRFEEEGVESVVHGNMGRSPVGKTPMEVVEKIKALAGEGGKYRDLSVCHLHDLLSEYEGISIGRSTLDRLLKQNGIKQSRTGHRGIYRKRRQRSGAEGWMVQIDGSAHDWLEGRGPRLVLMGAIDDATGKILFLEFRPSEDQAGYLRMFRHIAVTYGLPQSYYHDRHTMLQSPKVLTIEEELDGVEPLSELQRVLKTLGIESIGAHSPQAKGRIERLWGILQDRLVKELRLAGICTLEAANAFLPGFMERHNARFAKEPSDPQTAWVAIQPDMDLVYYFSTQETRVVGNDHVISWQKRAFQILVGPGENCLARRKVTVHTTPEGDVYLYDATRRLRYKELADRPKRLPDAPANKPASPEAKTPDPQAQRRRRAWLYSGV